MKSGSRVLDDPTPTVRDHVLVEDDVRRKVGRLIGIPHRIRTLVTEDWKYTRWVDGQEPLFDLASDPNEMHDLAHHADPRVVEASGRLLDVMIDNTDDARGAPVK